VLFVVLPKRKQARSESEAKSESSSNNHLSFSRSLGAFQSGMLQVRARIRMRKSHRMVMFIDIFFMDSLGVRRRGENTLREGNFATGLVHTQTLDVVVVVVAVTAAVSKTSKLRNKNPSF
jgi:hypothetical protein